VEVKDVHRDVWLLQQYTPFPDGYIIRFELFTLFFSSIFTGSLCHRDLQFSSVESFLFCRGWVSMMLYTEFILVIRFSCYPIVNIFKQIVGIYSLVPWNELFLLWDSGKSEKCGKNKTLTTKAQ
jgi:hypothetical protein